jgi:hypothetical protein
MVYCLVFTIHYKPSLGFYCDWIMSLEDFLEQGCQE